MKDEGFDYTPAPYRPGSAIGESRADLLAGGFGVFILVGEDVVVVNPNATYRASLPSSAAAEYELALNGAPLLAPEPG